MRLSVNWSKDRRIGKAAKVKINKNNRSKVVYLSQKYQKFTPSTVCSKETAEAAEKKELRRE